MRWLKRIFGRKTETAADRRQHPRYRMELIVTVSAGGRTFRGRSKDLSQSGMGAYFDGELEIGEQVELAYELGDGSPAKRRTAIVRSRAGKRYGLEFTA